MLTRISNITSYEHQSPKMPTAVPATNIVFHWHDEYYTSRVIGHLTSADVEVEEEHFIERCFRRPRLQ